MSDELIQIPEFLRGTTTTKALRGCSFCEIACESDAMSCGCGQIDCQTAAQDCSSSCQGCTTSCQLGTCMSSCLHTCESTCLISTQCTTPCQSGCMSTCESSCISCETGQSVTDRGQITSHDATKNTITVYFQSIAYAATYVVVWRLASDSTLIGSSGQIRTQFYTITGLQPNTRYAINYYGVASNGSTGPYMTTPYYATTDPQGVIAYIGNGSSWDEYTPYIGDGSAWQPYEPKIGDGTNWD